ncbi:MAG: hypothetical protein V9G12_24025 [Microthrixaceae bacterium]
MPSHVPSPPSQPEIKTTVASPWPVQRRCIRPPGIATSRSTSPVGRTAAGDATEASGAAVTGVPVDALAAIGVSVEPQAAPAMAAARTTAASRAVRREMRRQCEALPPGSPGDRGVSVVVWVVVVGFMSCSSVG